MGADVRHVVVVLLRRADQAEALVRLLDGLESAHAATVVQPPVRGRSFFDDPVVQADLDRWWAVTMPRHARSLLVFEHEPGLGPWLQGVDGSILVGLPAGADDAEYADLAAVQCFPAEHALDYAAQVISVLDPLRRGSPQEADTGPPSRRGADERTPLVLEDAIATDPFALLAAEPSPPIRVAPSVVRPRPRFEAPARNIPFLRLVRNHRTSEPAVDDRELARALALRGSTIVAVGSRKGGVGKTSHAAGIAICAGECLDRVGHRAVIVDSNLANPDAWGQLSLASEATTVRQAISALTAGRVVPEPIHAATPALACFPESRDASEYSRLEIARFAAYLREHFTFAVIDMSNRMPDPTGGPEAAAAAYWMAEADVLVLPTGSAKQDYNGVLDYLDLGSLPPTVVAQIVARSRRNREHPLARQYVEAIRARVHEVVELPDEAERVRYAVLEGLPVQDVSAPLRSAYRRLTRAVVSAAPVLA